MNANESNLSAFTASVKAAAALVKGSAQESRAGNRLRAFLKGSLRRSASEALAGFREALLAMPEHAACLESRDVQSFVAHFAKATSIELGRVLSGLPESAQNEAFDLFVVAYNAAISCPGPSVADPRWSEIASLLLGKRVDVSVPTGARLDEIVVLAQGLMDSMSEVPKASSELLEDLDVSGLEPVSSPADDANPYAFMLRKIAELLPDRIDVASCIDGIGDALRSERARPAVSCLHKICKRVDATLLESLLSKVLMSFDATSLESLIASAQNVDASCVSREVAVLSKSIRQAEVVDSVRALLASVDPELLKGSLKAVIGSQQVSRESVSEIVHKVIGSNMFPGLAARVPEIFRKDNTINYDVLVRAITQRARIPAPPRLRASRAAV